MDDVLSSTSGESGCVIQGERLCERSVMHLLLLSSYPRGVYEEITTRTRPFRRQGLLKRVTMGLFKVQDNRN